MITSLKNIVATATNNLFKKMEIRAKLIATEHFQERLIKRFQDKEFTYLEKTIEKAFEKAIPGRKIKYTHPLYNITIVAKRIGINGLELITCWKAGEEDTGYVC